MPREVVEYRAIGVDRFEDGRVDRDECDWRRKYADAETDLENMLPSPLPDEPDMDVVSHALTERVAKELTLSPYTVENWARQGRLPSFKIGRLRRYSRHQILDWKHRQMNPNKEGGGAE